MLPDSLPVSLSVCLCLALAGAATGQGATKKLAEQDLKKLQGEWKLVRCETDGSKLDLRAKLVISGKSYALDLGVGVDKGAFSLDSSKEPREWDSQSSGVEDTVRAIYDLNGNCLMFAYRFDDKRPTSLFGKLGSDEGHVLYVFERGDGKPERPINWPKIDHSKIVVEAKNAPFRKEIELSQGDVWIVTLPNGKKVTLWGEKSGARAGCYCRWEHETFIKQGPVIYTDKTIEHRLFIGEWRLSYVNDRESSPKLKLTVIVTKRDKTDSEAEENDF